jgi:hypothetical protein
MIRFFSGVVFGWVMARDPPSPENMKDAIERIYALLTDKNL